MSLGIATWGYWGGSGETVLINADHIETIVGDADPIVAELIPLADLEAEIVIDMEEIGTINLTLEVPTIIETEINTASPITCELKEE